MTENQRRKNSRCVSILLVVSLFLSFAPNAQAHATLNLSGANAIAGKKGVLTLTIPHGCLPSGSSTTKLVMKLDENWPNVTPKTVDGWTSSVGRSSSGGWVLTWRATSGGLPNVESGDFPIAVHWPKKPGIYNTPTAQYCGTQLMNWKDAFNAAADGDQTYPATYPVPRVKVRAKS